MTICNSYKNMFYNANNIKYINLYNCIKDCYTKLRNDLNKNIFVCQKSYDPNTDINYCCNYNLQNNSCTISDNSYKSNKPVNQTRQIKKGC